MLVWLVMLSFQGHGGWYCWCWIAQFCRTLTWKKMPLWCFTGKKKMCCWLLNIANVEKKFISSVSVRKLLHTALPAIVHARFPYSLKIFKYVSVWLVSQLYNDHPPIRSGDWPYHLRRVTIYWHLHYGSEQFLLPSIQIMCWPCNIKTIIMLNCMYFFFKCLQIIGFMAPVISNIDNVAKNL